MLSRLLSLVLLYGNTPPPAHLAVALDTAVLDLGEQKPGRAVEQGEHPARADDPAGPGQRADVLTGTWLVDWMALISSSPLLFTGGLFHR